ncbi:hypothetical protein MPSEU_000397000 [Mayamaea pseudoterrestris]|nr:hypothetical protein MPSEU_000397000 [Mayamaea pseudoterrestris]
MLPREGRRQCARHANCWQPTAGGGFILRVAAYCCVIATAAASTHRPRTSSAAARAFGIMSNDLIERRLHAINMVRGGAAEDEDLSSTFEGVPSVSKESNEFQRNATTAKTEAVADSEVHKLITGKSTQSGKSNIEDVSHFVKDEDSTEIDAEEHATATTESKLDTSTFAVDSDDTTSDEDEDEESVAAITTESEPMSRVTVLETTTTTLFTTEDDTQGHEVATSTTVASAISELSLSPNKVQAKASYLRTLGKELHDKSEFIQAAVQFGAAADLLLPLLQMPALEAEEEPVDDELANSDSLLEEFATCRLHEALCRLKAEEYNLAIYACTQVLDWNQESSRQDTSRSSKVGKFSSADVAPALRARAFHRRAKAFMELGNADRALSDARSAAFLGDRKAVALYGKLMRSTSGKGSANNLSSLSAFGDLFGAGETKDLSSSSSSGASMLESLLSGSSAFSPASSSTPQQQTDSPAPFLPASLLDFGKAAAGGQGSGLAKSVLSSLAKNLEDKSTQDTICNYLQSTSGPQLQQMASMAGISLQSSQADRVASFMNRATPRTIQRTVVFTKRSVYTVQLLRKLNQLVQKYRNWIVLFFLLAWIKSAILRPTPVSKKAIKAAAKHAARAVSGPIV